MKPSILKLDKVKKTYPGFSLRELSFELPTGYIMGFIGPNGAGKSTTLKLIMNFFPLESGKIEVFGLNHCEEEIQIKQQIGYVGEDQQFYEEMTVGWTINFVSRFYHNWDREYCRQLVNRFGLDSRQKVGQLSKGMKVKLALTLALSHHPRLLLLDEPTSGLDPIIRKEFLQELLEVVQDENRAILISSHITDDLEKVADYITLINQGRIVLSQPKDHLLDSWKQLIINDQSLIELIKPWIIYWEPGSSNRIGYTDNFFELKRTFSPQLAKNLIAVENMALADIMLVSVKGER